MRPDQTRNKRKNAPLSGTHGVKREQMSSHYQASTSASCAAGYPKRHVTLQLTTAQEPTTFVAGSFSALR
jgi:hypothetical protein